MIRRKTCFLMAVLILFVNLSACSQSGTDSRTVDENGRKVITFTCANLTTSDEGVLKIAVEKFEKENPGAVVDIKDLSKLGYDANKYVSTINTELMAGKGPDIIPLSYLPSARYFKKNIFIDLGEMIKNDKEFKTENFVPNVLEASKFDGKLYAIPAYFSFSGVIGSKKILDEEGIVINDNSWTTSDFINIAKKVTRDLNGDGTIDRYALPQMPMEGVTKLFINTESYVDFENKKASFNSPDFVELLKSLKSISDNKLTHKKFQLSQKIPYKNSQEIVFSGGSFEGYRGLLSRKYCLGGGDRVLFRLPSVRKSAKYPFDSRMMLAINRASKNKDLAWKFLKTILSEDIQDQFASSSSTSGFPIGKKALQKQKERILGLDWRVQDDAEGWVPIRFTEEELKFVDNYIKNINIFQYNDSRVENVVIDEIDALFSKEFIFSKKSAEDVAKSIQKKVQLYLDE